MTSRRSERGQAMVLTLVFLSVLLAMSAAVIDVGAWYRAHRAVQATADASALAAVTSLPESTSESSTLALDYAGRNGAGVTAGDVVFSSTHVTNDTVQVTARRTVQGLFASLFGVGFRHGARACQGPQLSNGRGEVRGADRSRHQAPDAPMRAPARASTSRRSSIYRKPVPAPSG